MDDNHLRGLGALATLLFLLFMRRKQKEAEVRRQDVRAYDPIEPERIEGWARIGKIFSGMVRVYSIGAGAALVFVVLGLAEFESMTRRVVLGTIGLLLLIYVIFKNRDGGDIPDPYLNDRWEDEP